MTFIYCQRNLPIIYETICQSNKLNRDMTLCMYARSLQVLENNSLYVTAIKLAATLCMRRRFCFFEVSAGVFPSHSFLLFYHKTLLFIHYFFYLYFAF